MERGKGKVPVSMVCPWAIPGVLHMHLCQVMERKVPDLHMCWSTGSGNQSMILDLWWAGRAPNQYAAPPGRAWED